MRPDHEAALAERPIDQLDARQVMGVSPCAPLMLALRARDQATVVLALLRADRVPAAEHLVGRPITRLPPRAATLAPPPALETDDRALDPRVIVSVMPNPRLPTTPAWSRYRLFAVGRTIGEFYRRGGRRGDVRLALRKKWIQVAEGRR